MDVAVIGNGVALVTNQFVCPSSIGLSVSIVVQNFDNDNFVPHNVDGLLASPFAREVIDGQRCGPLPMVVMVPHS